MVTILMPVSRDTYLKEIFARLEYLECDSKTTNLLVLVDGDASLFVEARNHVEMSKFNDRLCVQFKSKHKLRHYDVLSRRLRISDIHNEAKQYIQKSDYIFGIEDDTIIPSNALQKLLKEYLINPYMGFIQGIEYGRWGVQYAGAWQADDTYEPTLIKSMPYGSGTVLVDAGGFYCFLTKAEIYMAHTFKPFEGNSLGPDVDYGLELRRQGYQNYTDWDVKCVHRTKDKSIRVTEHDLQFVQFTKKENRWRQSRP